MQILSFLWGGFHFLHLLKRKKSIYNIVGLLILVCLTIHRIVKYTYASPHHRYTNAHTHAQIPLSSQANLILAVKAAGICYFVLFGISASSHLIQTVS